MKIDENLFEQIEAYLGGKLPQEEEERFEQQIAADPELQELVEKHRFEREGLEYLVQEDLLEKITKWEAEMPSVQLPNVRKKWWRGGGLGVLAVILLIAGWWLLGNDNQLPVDNPLPPELPEESAPAPIREETQEKPVVTTPDAPETKVQKDENPAKRFPEYLAISKNNYTVPEYFNGSNIRNTPDGSVLSRVDSLILDFNKAKNKDENNLLILELRKLKPEEVPQQYELAQELLGHAYYKAKRFAEAAAVFQSLMEETPIPGFREQFEWYLLLSLIPDYPEHRQLVNNLLTEMIDRNPAHGFKASAIKLRQKLDVVTK